MSLAIDASGGTTARSAASTPPAQDLVAQATDRATGAVDTRQLAQWVADAGRASPEKASAAYAQIENRLGTGDRSRFAQDVVHAAQGTSVAGVANGVAVTGSRVLKNNPILHVEWHSTVSPVTNRSGFSGPLQQLLDQHGISYSTAAHSKPPAAANNNSPAARNHNGDAARDQIADGFEKNGYTVRTEQSTDAAGRDVKGEVTPKMTSNCEISIIPPMPHEKPVTTACGTRPICRPNRSAANSIMMRDAMMHSVAASPTPPRRAAKAMKGTVALAVPPIRTGFRPKSAITGAVRIEVNTPSTGGRPISEAMARP